MSNRFDLNRRQIIKGFTMAIFVAVITLLEDYSKLPNFTLQMFTQITFWNAIFLASYKAGLGYIVLTFIEGKSKSESIKNQESITTENNVSNN